VPVLLNACVELLDRRVELGDGDRIAIACQGRTLTYADTLAETQRVAAGLRALGVRPEERVALALLDSVEYVSAFLGAMRIGAVPVPINPLLPLRDLAIIIADARARVALVSQERVGAEGTAALRAAAPEVATVISTGPTWDKAFPTAVGDLAAASAVYATWDESPGFWLCTSGSTGQPKLAMHRHNDLLSPALGYAREVLTIGATDICLSVGPAFHAYGLGNSISFPFSVGARAVLEPTRPPTPKLVAELVQKHRPTLFFCIPTFYSALLAADVPDDTFSSVRLAVSAAEPLPAETYHRFRKRFGVQILDGIGSTELTHIFISNRPDPGTRPGTSGTPVSGYEIRLVDEAGLDVGIKEAGHLLVSGDSMATGYWCRSEQNRQTFLGPWMRTGDMYQLADDGFLTYLGRSDDMLRVGGEWVSPAEVESVLIEHSSVLEAAVVGVPDDLGVVRPVAWIVVTPGVEPPGGQALDDHCRERLAGYKRPRRYELVESLPKTATGKIQRFLLR
jgi:benzoate-CoA ligase family protein